MNKTILFCILFLSIGHSLYCLSQEKGMKNTEQAIAIIKQQFKEINAQINNYGKIEKNILDESSEGGILMGFYAQSDLKKISVTYYGETGKSLTDYYFNNREIIFVFKCDFSYDKPIYIQGSKIASIKESRYYFYQKKLIRYIKSDSQVVSNQMQILVESKRLYKDAERYQNLLGAYKTSNMVISTDTVRCRFGLQCPSTGYILKDSRDSTGQVIHVNPVNKNVPIEK